MSVYVPEATDPSSRRCSLPFLQHQPSDVASTRSFLCHLDFAKLTQSVHEAANLLSRQIVVLQAVVATWVGCSAIDEEGGKRHARRCHAGDLECC